MNKIYQLVLRSYAGPLILTFFIAVFILLMQFVWLYIDDLIGKGLEWYVIAELLFYASWTTVPMALPLSILLSSLMTFGNLGEHYELVAIKSSGISLWRTMRPLVILSVFISIGAFFFSNNALPYVALKRNSLLYDIKKKKLSFNIKEGEFYHDIDGYVLRVGRKSKDGKTLYDVLIYDHTSGEGATKVTTAESGTMVMAKDESIIVLTLYNGSNYEEGGNQRGANATTRPMQRMFFETQIMNFDISTFEMSRTDEDLFKSNYSMLNLDQLNCAIDSLSGKLSKRQDEFVKNQVAAYTVLRPPDTTASVLPSEPIAGEVHYDPRKPLDSLSERQKKAIVSSAIRNTRSLKQSAEFYATDIKNQKTTIIKHETVRHEKFTLSFACLVLFFIGAPLGSIIRKGGLGLPVVMATIMFIIYHVISMIGKKYALAGALPVWTGMWLSAFLLLPLGLFLSIKANNDSPLFDVDSWKKIIYRILYKKKRE